MPVTRAFLIDYEYCLGCSECETACMSAHDAEVGQLGIRVVKLGPLKVDDGCWQYDFIPIPTDLCDLCEQRTGQGLHPACVRHCQYGVISIESLDTQVDALRLKPKMLVFTPRCMDEG